MWASSPRGTERESDEIQWVILSEDGEEEGMVQSGRMSGEDDGGRRERDGERTELA